MLVMIIALAVVALDQITKVLAANYLAALPGQTYALWPGVFHLTYTENRGAAFGMLQDARWFFIVATLVACTLLVAFLYKERARMHLLMKVTLALILGGALGNFIDRLFLGYVRDMFSAIIINFAIFNVADSAISVGCVLLFIDLLFLKGKVYMADQPKAKTENVPPQDKGDGGPLA